MAKQQFGIIGMAVMGQNLALNVASKGFSVAVFNRTAAKTEDFMATKGMGAGIVAAYSVEDFVAALETPRKIMLMVKAGAAVDAFIEKLTPLLARGDVLIDGGNSYYKDTERRGEEAARAGLLYIGTGVSGGEEGALKGPSIMPGGHRQAYEIVGPILTACAAQVAEGPCCTYIGPRGAGHYVKMVHNGIEYGIMAAIAEAYDLLKTALGLSAPEIGQLAAEWNAAEMDSYLMEITAVNLQRMDEETGQPLVDVILDKAGQKGTGKWASQDALDVGVPIPTINAAVEQRILSAFKDERVIAAGLLRGVKKTYKGRPERLITAVRSALYGSTITAYAQGMTLLRWATKEHDYQLNLPEIAQIWKGGCIIRSVLLEDIRKAFRKQPDLPNLMIDKVFTRRLSKVQSRWRFAVQTAVGLGVPVLALGASLSYYDAYRRERMPANLTQAQRDYFGAHTYERLDREGSFHMEWGKP